MSSKRNQAEKVAWHTIPFLWNSGKGKIEDKKIVEWGHHAWLEELDRGTIQARGDKILLFTGWEKVACERSGEDFSAITEICYADIEMYNSRILVCLKTISYLKVHKIY